MPDRQTLTISIEVRPGTATAREACVATGSPYDPEATPALAISGIDETNREAVQAVVARFLANADLVSLKIERSDGPT